MDEKNGLTEQDIEALRTPFKPHDLGVKVQAKNKAKTKAMLVLYIQHTRVYERIDQVDPSWNSKVVAEGWETVEEFGQAERKCFTRTALTIKGVTRENTGDGSDPKGATSDSLKRAAMLFGVGRYLSDTGRVWVDYDESKDKYRAFQIEDWVDAAKAQGLPPPPGFEEFVNKPDVTTKAAEPSAVVGDIVEAETVQLEKLKVPRPHVLAYLDAGNYRDSKDAANALRLVRTSYNLNAVRKMMADAYLKKSRHAA